MSESAHAAWPVLHYDAWADTCTTLHLWTQIVGKVRLAVTPWLNHSWHVPLYVTARGLTTSPMPHGSRTFELRFDFIDHVLRCETSDGDTANIALVPRPVAEFKAEVLGALVRLRVPVSITDRPCEIAEAIPFSTDRVHCTYEPEHARRFFRVLVQADRVLKQFRTAFIGKCSPVQFFWGSFDLAVTRFSGRRAPLHPGTAPGVAPRVMQEAYSHEVSSAGFWPGAPGADAAFYSYAYPEPADFATAAVHPAEARYSATMREFLLPYEAVRSAADPDTTLLAFLESTYVAAAELAAWDRAELECPPGAPEVCRPLA